LSNTGKKGITFRPASETQGAGYVVVVSWAGKRRYKRFQVSTHDGKRKALIAALEWRNTQEGKMAKPRTERKVRRFATRRVGISRYQPFGGGRPVWEARIKTPEGRTLKSRFSVDRWGEDIAHEKAVSKRKAWERQYYGGELQ